MSEYKLIRMVLGEYRTNTYIIGNEAGEAVIVDPADRPEEIMKIAADNGLTVKRILQTHGHFDHVLASDGVRTATGCEVYLHENDRALAAKSELNADVLLKGGENFELIGCEWKVLHTPGHTPGSVCYYIPSEGILFSGDTLFYGTYGRTDLEGGSYEAIEHSIRDILFCLPDDTRVLPGHGATTDIAAEKRHNQILY